MILSKTESCECTMYTPGQKFTFNWKEMLVSLFLFLYVHIKVITNTTSRKQCLFLNSLGTVGPSNWVPTFHRWSSRVWKRHMASCWNESWPLFPGVSLPLARRQLTSRELRAGGSGHLPKAWLDKEKIPAHLEYLAQKRPSAQEGWAD